MSKLATTHNILHRLEIYLDLPVKVRQKLTSLIYFLFDYFGFVLVVLDLQYLQNYRLALLRVPCLLDNERHIESVPCLLLLDHPVYDVLYS